MTVITDMDGVLQTESSGWLLKSPLAGGRGTDIKAVLVMVTLCQEVTAVQFLLDTGSIPTLVVMLATAGDEQ